MNSYGNLFELSQKLKVPLKEVSQKNRNKMENIYQDYDVSLVLDSWFLESFLLVFENGEYVAKTQSMDDDGFPSILNWTLGFGGVDTIVDNEFAGKFSKNGFIQIAEAANGDPLVVDLQSTTYSTGYFSHELIWQERSPNLRKIFQKVATLEKFFELIINDKEVPTEYKF